MNRRQTSWRLRRLGGLTILLFPWNLFWDQRFVLSTLVRTQIARRHRRSVLGWAWNIIQPGSQAILLFAATRGAVRVPESTSPLGGFGIFFAAFIIGQGMGEIVGRGPTLVAERAWLGEGVALPARAAGAHRRWGRALPDHPGRPARGGRRGDRRRHWRPAWPRSLAFTVGLLLAIVWGTALGLAFAALGVYLRDAILAAPVITMALIFVSPLYLNPEGGGLLGLLPSSSTR